jgi:lysophospholipid acyltransferase (LPLAT)-like uncharacterized protein
LTKALTTVAAGGVRLWVRSLRVDYRSDGPPVIPECAGNQQFIYSVWHEYLLIPLLRFAGPKVHALISRSQDAQWLVEICRRFQIPVIRGSTRRGGAEAVRQLLRIGPGRHVAITPDGPRGPRRRVQPGLIYLASRSGMSIVPIGIGLDQPWRLSSWDRFAVPRPRSRAVCMTSTPLVVPPDLNTRQLEEYRQAVEEKMHAVTAAAEARMRRAA